MLLTDLQVHAHFLQTLHLVYLKEDVFHPAVLESQLQTHSDFYNLKMSAFVIPSGVQSWSWKGCCISVLWSLRIPQLSLQISVWHICPFKYSEFLDVFLSLGSIQYTHVRNTNHNYQLVRKTLIFKYLEYLWSLLLPKRKWAIFL